MSRLILVTILFSSFVFCGVLSAKPALKRIEQGVKSGQLTKKETQELKDEQNNIKEMKEKAKADGVVTQKEKNKIRAARKAASKNIYQEKHDAEKATKK
jgi:hypothetical protein